jgi:predicted DsbA family dithiol-disulfide isomerase
MKAKYEEPRVMRELHEIRVRHYEETKHMTDEEYVKHVNEAARKIAEEYNLKFNFVEKH